MSAPTGTTTGTIESPGPGVWAQPGESIDTRIERLEVRVELQDLVAQYGAAIDDRDIDRVAELFTPDGRFGHMEEEGVAGRDAIKAFYTERLRGQAYSFHYPLTQVMTSWEGDTATGVVAAQAEMGREGQVLIACMRYHDDYRRHEGRWRFAQRRLAFWYFLPASDLVQGRLGDERKRWPAPRPADLPDKLPSYQRFLATEASGS